MMRFGRAGGRVATSLAGLLAVSILLFAATEVLPGDAAATALGPSRTESQVAELKRRLALDGGAVDRYAGWLGDTVKGDLGTSTQTRRPVAEMIGPAAGNTALLLCIAWPVAGAIALVLGVSAGVRQGGRLDGLISAGAIAALALPEMSWAVALIAVFATALEALPAVSLVPASGTPLSAPEILVLPVACLVLVGGAWAIRMVRAAVADQAGSAHVEAARLAGLSPGAILFRHLLPGALGPTAQALAWLLALLVGATVIVEQAFGYPGLAQVLVQGVRAHDLPVVEATGMLLAVSVAAALLLADLLTIAVDPRALRRP